MARPRRITRRNTGGTLQSRAAAHGANRSPAPKVAQPVRKGASRGASFQQPRTTRPSRRAPETLKGVAGRTPLPQPEREQRRQDRIKSFSGPGAVRTAAEVDEMLRSGSITQAQADAAKGQLARGAPGVNPSGFASDVRPEDIRPVRQQGAEAQRRPAGAPLQDPRSGAMGRPGATGRGEVRSPRTGETLADIDRQEERAARKGFTGFASREEAQREFSRRREEIRRDSEAERQKQLDKAEMEKLTAPTDTIDPGFGLRGSDVDTSTSTSAVQNISTKGQEIQSLPGTESYISQISDLNQKQNDILAQQRDFALAGIDDGSELLEFAEDREEKLFERDRRRANIAKEDKRIALEAAEVARQLAQIEKNKFEISQQRREQNQRRINIENEEKNRRIAGRLGITSDTNGLRWMSEQVRRGEEQLQYMEEIGDLESSRLAVEIGRQYNINVRSALNKYDEASLIIDERFDSEMDSIDKMISLDRKERRQERQKIWDKYWEQKAENDKTAGDRIHDFNMEMFKQVQINQREARKRSMDGIVPMKDTIETVRELRKEINQNTFITDARAVDSKFNSINAALNSWLNAPEGTDKTAIEQVIITSFNKITDPTSVVRESEYARSEEGQSVLRRFESAWDRVTVGGNVTEETLVEIRNTAELLNNEYKKQLQRDLQPYIAEVDMFNEQPNLQRPIKLSDILPPNLIPPSMEGQYKIWEQQMKGSNPNDFSMDGFRPSSGSGWRTDRHNNPIAAAVRAGGTNEFTRALDNAGIAWSHGDPFPNNKGMVTIRIDGDPIEGARAILSETGAIENWYKNHTGKQILPKFGVSSGKEFSMLPKDSQNAIIAGIYKAEAGDGSLLAGVTNTSTPENNVQTYSFIPTASAAEFDVQITPELPDELPEQPEDSGAGLLTGEDLKIIRDSAPENRAEVKRQIIAMKQSKLAMDQLRNENPGFFERLGKASTDILLEKPSSMIKEGAEDFMAATAQLGRSVQPHVNDIVDFSLPKVAQFTSGVTQ